MRVATYNPELARDGPGLLLRDVLKGEDPQINAVRDVIVQVAPDVLLLTSFDFDHGLHALSGFADLLREAGLDYPYIFALAPNSGMATGLDMDGDRRLGEARDAQGYGEFAGQGGLALLSRFPVAVEAVQDFSGLLWADFPDAQIPVVDGAPFPSAEAIAVQRLSSTGHWDVPVDLPDGRRMHLLAFRAGTPAFDRAVPRNVRRNHDEVRFWQAYLEGALPAEPPKARFVILGDANLDPKDGLGMRQAIKALIEHPTLLDPAPVSAGGREAAIAQGGVNQRQSGDPALDTADWRDEKGPGNLRVDYVLPSRDWQVLDAGVFWPASDDPLREILGEGDARASRHALVWVDLGW